MREYKQPSQAHIREFGYNRLSSAYEFFRTSPGWHSYANDSLTVRTIETLAEYGVLELNEFNQARFIIKKHITA